MNSSQWPAAVDEILDGDQAVMLGSVTPASGVVLMPVTNFAVRDRTAGTIAVNSSVGAWKKLDRIRRNPCVALAFHTRLHGFTDRPEYVLVQGRATVGDPVPGYPATIGGNWERFAGAGDRSPLWRRWLRVYHTRVEIKLAVERVIVWPDLACSGDLQVYGPALPAGPPPEQRPPSGGIEPRIDHGKAARRAAGLRDVLLGWTGADGLPMIVPVRVGGGDWIRLQAPAGHVPPGGRRAGLTAHSFTRHVVGQRQRVHTGWLEADSGGVRYSPHTQFSYWMPPSKLVYRLAVGAATRVGHRRSH